MELQAYQHHSEDSKDDMNPSEPKPDSYPTSHESEEFPPLPKQTLFCAISLFLSGVLLVILGFIEEITDVDPTKGIAFWVLGSLVLIPGVYYSFKFYQAYRAPTAVERMRVLRDIPNFA